MIVDLFVVLIFLLLVGFGVAGYLAWKKIEVFLTWNTRFDSKEYEQAITTPKITKPYLPAQKTERRGRQIKQVDELVDIADVEFETAYKAVAEVGET